MNFDDFSGTTVELQIAVFSGSKSLLTDSVRRSETDCLVLRRWLLLTTKCLTSVRTAYYYDVFDVTLISGTVLIFIDINRLFLAIPNVATER